MPENKIPNGTIRNITSEIIKNQSINSYDELVEEVHSHSGHNSPIEENPDQLRNGFGQNYQPEVEEVEIRCNFVMEKEVEGEKDYFFCNEVVPQTQISYYDGLPKLYCDTHIPKSPLEELRDKYQKQAEKWWFQPQDQEEKQLDEAGEIKQLQQVWQEANDRRNFWGHWIFIIFCVLFFCGWNKFWAWYEKPLTDEWGWNDDEEEEDDEDEKPATPEEKKEPGEEIPVPKTRWGRVKNWPRNNIVRTISLLILFISAIHLIVKVVKLL